MGYYRNIMELLVEAEVKRQIRLLPTRVAAYINPVELIAYALNQLPSLYATSEKGLECQFQRGKLQFDAEIKQAVRRAIAAVQRDPIRTCIPLQPRPQSAHLQRVLYQLRLLLKNDKIDWEMLPNAVADALSRSKSATSAWDSYSEPPLASSYPIANEPTYKNRRYDTLLNQTEASELPPLNAKRPTANLDSPSDWDDPFHRL